MRLRPYRPSDCQALAALFYDTVHGVNRRDYTPEQLEAWADGRVDLAGWNASLLAHLTLVAEEDGGIVGFADMDDGGYLDRLYVHRARQGEGIATALCDALEDKVAAGEYTTHASITARYFFEQRGYHMIRGQQVERHGVSLLNYIMKKYSGA